MPTLTATVVNCLIVGMEFTEYPDGSRTRNVINFKCDKWTFRFLQKDEVITQASSLRGTLCETTTVEVDDVDPACLEDALETLNSICWLLSFATQSQVHHNSYQFNGSRHFTSATGTLANPTQSPFNLSSGIEIKDFIEQTYPAYRKLHKIRNLPVVFDYLTQAELPNQPMEIRLLLLFITIENLKHSYAVTANIPFTKKHFRTPTNAIFNFKNLVEAMLKSVRIEEDIESIKALRDEIIHTGLTGEPLGWQRNMYASIQNLVREYILRLLGYKGKFVIYGSRGFGFKEIS